MGRARARAREGPWGWGWGPGVSASWLPGTESALAMLQLRCPFVEELFRAGIWDIPQRH